ncbi:hypothetical protein S83_031409, partial [Arachis hypogaea]
NNLIQAIEREIGALQLEEKKLLAEIKRTAKTGNEAAIKVLARQLVRLTQQIANLQGSQAQMRGIATHTQVYVVRLWENPSKFNEKEVGSIEMILQDIK